MNFKIINLHTEEKSTWEGITRFVYQIAQKYQ